MGAASSKAGGIDEEKTFYSERETPITFAPGLINQLSDANKDVSPQRQATLDEHIQSRIKAETQRLKQQEADVAAQVQAALAKENIEKETAQVKSGATSSADLSRDLEAITKKVERNKTQRDRIEGVLGQSREALIACYQKNQSRPLDCWREVEAFERVVKGLEKDFIKSI